MGFCKFSQTRTKTCKVYDIPLYVVVFKDEVLSNFLVMTTTCNGHKEKVLLLKQLVANETGFGKFYVTSVHVSAVIRKEIVVNFPKPDIYEQVLYFFPTSN